MALVAAAVGALPLLSCGQRSLVLLDVRASTAFADPTVLQDVRLTVVANHEVTTRYPRIRLSTSASYQIGMYLPSDMTGTVSFEATIDDGRCIIGAGTAVANGVQSGETTAAVPIIIAPTTDCGNIDGGTAGTGGSGTAGAGGNGGNGGNGGMTGVGGTTGSAGSSPVGVGGTGGTGATAGGGGTVGSGGSGGVTTGTAGRGGTTGGGGLSGAAGTTGAAGRGGTTGTGGVSGVAGTTGAAGRSGTSGTGGVSGVAGTTGAGGIGGVTGTAGRGGSTGAGGLGGVTGVGGGPGVGGSVGGGGPGIGGTGPGVGGSGVAGTTGLGGIGVAGTGGGLCGTIGCLPPWMCDANGFCVCSETPAQACARAGIQCGYVFDNCNNQQFCSCPIVGTICDTQTNKCMAGCITGTGGIVTADIICPVGN